VGCAGVITHSERLSDGRFNIVLRGLEKFRVLDEDDSQPYRLARIDAIPDAIAEADRPAMRQQRHRLEAVLVAAVERGGSEPRFPPAVGDEDLVNALAQYLTFEPVERQALLECAGPLARCAALIDLLEIRTLAPPGMNWKGRAVH
jgi:Lon protease-like protein